MYRYCQLDVRERLRDVLAKVLAADGEAPVAEVGLRRGELSGLRA
jgi:hypothetical protein